MCLYYVHCLALSRTHTYTHLHTCIQIYVRTYIHILYTLRTLAVRNVQKAFISEWISTTDICPSPQAASSSTPVYQTWEYWLTISAVMIGSVVVTYTMMKKSYTHSRDNQQFNQLSDVSL